MRSERQRGSCRGCVPRRHVGWGTRLSTVVPSGSWTAYPALRYRVHGEPVRQHEEIAMPDTKIALVTGANKGIGLQIAKDLAAHQFTVLLGSRDLQRGEAAAQTIDGTAEAVQLDVTDPASIAVAAQHIDSEYGHLDV